MPTSTYTALASVSLASSVSSVLFELINQSYKDLILVINGKKTTADADAYMLFNGDSGSNYNRLRMSGSGSSALSAAASNDTRGYIDSYGYVTTNFSYGVMVQLMDYSATDKHKTYLSRSNNADSGVDAIVGRWASTSAITSISLYLSSDQWATGTTFDLYGIEA